MTFHLAAACLLAEGPRSVRTAGDFLPRYGITYAQYEDLLKQKVGEIKELDFAWQSNREGRFATYLFGGGRFRGLLRWIDDKLTSGTYYGTLLRTSPPSLSELASQKATDRDLVAIGRPIRPVDGWDVLNETFYRNSIDAGGPSLEKVFVSPYQISDPYGALKAFANGSLEFIQVDASQFERTLWARDGVRDNSRLAQALRFVRFLQEFPQHQPTAESEAYVKSLAASEDRFRAPDQADNWWIHKGLLRLFGASQGNVATFVGLLKRHNLFRLLDARRISTDSKQRIISLQELRASLDPNWSIDDLPALERVIGGKNMGARLTLKRHLLKAVKTPSDLAKVLHPNYAPNPILRNQIRELFLEGTSALKLSSGPILNDILEEPFTDIEAILRMRDLLLPLAQTPEDFRRVASYGSANLVNHAALRSRLWLDKNVGVLRSLRPSLEAALAVVLGNGSEEKFSPAMTELILELTPSGEELQKIKHRLSPPKGEAMWQLLFRISGIRQAPANWTRFIEQTNGWLSPEHRARVLFANLTELQAEARRTSGVLETILPTVGGSPLARARLLSGLPKQILPQGLGAATRTCLWFHNALARP